MIIHNSESTHIFYKNQNIYSKSQQGADKENILELNQIRTQKVKKFI